MDQDREVTERERDPRKVNTSMRFYEFLMINVKPGKNSLINMLSAQQESDLRLAEAFRGHCQKCKELFGTGINPGAPGDDCRTDSSVRYDQVGRLTTDPRWDPAWRDHHQQFKNFWNMDNKRYHCHKDFVDSTNHLSCLCFGTVDLIKIIPSPCLLWSNFVRMAYAKNPYVSGLFSLPMARVKYRAVVGADGEVRETPQLRFQLPAENNRFVFFTFIHGPALAGSKQATSKTIRKDFLLETANLLDQRYRTTHKLELFLTFSGSYPVMVKSEFSDYDEGMRFIRQLGIASKHLSRNSTIVSWYNEHLLDTKMIEMPYFENAPNPVQFNLMLKLKNSSGRGLGDDPDLIPLYVSEVIRELDYRLILEEGMGKGVPGSIQSRFRVFFRPCYWDNLLAFETRQISKLMWLLSRELHQPGQVAQIATLPLSSANQFKLSDERSERDTPGEDESAPETANPAGDDRAWSDSLGSMPLMPWGSGRPHENTINQRWAWLREQYRWLFSYVAQLRKSWESQSWLFGSTRNHSYPRTFDHLDHLLRENLKFLLEIDGRIGDSKSPEDFEERADSLHQAGERFRDVMDILMRVIAEFNEKTEGNQAVMLTEHFMKAGEQTGVLDLLSAASDRLFRQYCSGPNPGSGFWGPIDRNDALYEWRGITTSSSGADFKVRPDLEILFLPAEMRLNAANQFIVLAHEAAHLTYSRMEQKFRQPAVPAWGENTADAHAFHPFTLFSRCSSTYQQEFRADQELGAKLGGFATEMQKLGSPVTYRVRKIIELAGSLRETEKTREVFEQVRAQVRACKDEWVSRMVEGEFQWLQAGPGAGPGSDVVRKCLEEHIMDIMALLTSGPSFIRALMFTRFRPTLLEPASDSHPQRWLRIALLWKLAKKLGWFEDDVFQIDHLVTTHFRQYETCQGKSLVEHLEDYPSSNSLCHHLQRDLGISLPTFDLFQSIAYPENCSGDDRSMKDGGMFAVRDLIVWSQLNGRHFHYYPFPLDDYNGGSGGRRVDGFSAAEMARYQRVIRYVNAYTKILSDRMIHNSEVILDAPLRYIAAASMFPVHSHADFQNGRVIHSLYYSEDPADDFIKKIEGLGLKVSFGL